MTEQKCVYVSITGLDLKRKRHVFRNGFRFAWHAFLSMRQAKRASGNLQAEAKTIDGVHHTLTVRESEAHMRRFLYRGAHREAIGAFPDIATGKTFGFETERVPDWSEVHALWRERGRAYTPLN